MEPGEMSTLRGVGSLARARVREAAELLAIPDESPASSAPAPTSMRTTLPRARAPRVSNYCIGYWQS